MVASRDNFPLLAELLAEQQRLATPVACFSEAHDAGAPASARVYRDLIPLSAPRPGERYAFEVDLDSCTGCKACVSACHALNGLDEHETWRDVGLVIGGDERHPFQQTVTTACHHCDDPACLNGCPVLAYEQDPLTGIVRHLDDQCIGCQYCILKCPYDAPKYNARLGIVRKCDMCHGRLAVGEAPACVQACPTHAIRIATIPVATAGARFTPGTIAPGSKTATEAPAAVPEFVTYYVTNSVLGGARGTVEFLRSAPGPEYTRPTTRYRSRRPQPADLRSADASALRVQPAHAPLVVMLTLLQVAVGCQLVVLFMSSILPKFVTYYVTNFGWSVGALGLGVSMGHLGRPGRAWRIFLGWRTSWLSREAMGLGAWMIAASAGLVWPPFTAIAAVLGVVGLACSVMVYVDTRRVAWRMAQTAPRFFGGMVVLGAAVAVATGVATGVAPTVSAAVLAAAMLGKLAVEAQLVRPAGEQDDDARPTAALQTARRLAGPLRAEFGCRVALGLAGGVLLPAMLAAGALPAGARGAVLVVVLAGEWLERRLFFRAVDAPKMPGMPT